jgi:hypothetical protein
MRIFGSLTAFKDMLSSFATVIGTADVASGASATVTLASGISSTGNSGAVYVKSGVANSGTRGTVYLDGGALELSGATIALITPTVNLSTTATVSAATALTLSSASHLLTQGSYTATLVVPATATITLPATTSTLATAASVSALYAVASTVTGSGSGTCDCASYSTFFSTVSGSTKTFAMHNMSEGRAVTLVVSAGALDNILAFNCFSDAGTTGLTECYSVYGALYMTSSATIVSFMRVGNNVYITLAHGFTA